MEDLDELEPLFALMSDVPIHGLARLVGCRHASLLLVYRDRRAPDRVLVDLLEGNMTWHDRGDMRQFAHPPATESATGLRGSRFVDVYVFF